MQTCKKPTWKAPETWGDCLSLAPEIRICAEDIAVVFGIIVPTQEVGNLSWDDAWAVFLGARRGSNLERKVVSRLLDIVSGIRELEAILKFVDPGSASARKIYNMIEDRCKEKLREASTLEDLRTLLHDCPFGSEVRSLVVREICFGTKL